MFPLPKCSVFWHCYIFPSFYLYPSGPCRRFMECVCIQCSGAGFPSEPCWCLEVWWWALRWYSLFLQTVCLPERAGYSCWRLSIFTGRYRTLALEAKIQVTHTINRYQGYLTLSCQRPPDSWPFRWETPHMWMAFCSLWGPSWEEFRCLFTLSVC